MTRRRLLAIGCVGAFALGSCGGASPANTPPADPHDLLRASKDVVDKAPSLHFTLTSQGTPPSGTPEIVGGSGDAKRPDAFSGTLQVQSHGFTVNAKVVSVNHTFWVSLVLGYQRANPSDYGFADPAGLLDRNTGLSSLLVTTKSANYSGRDRYNGQQLEEISVVLPGQEVANLLTSVDPSQDVSGTIGITPSTHQLRKVVLTGPFFDKKQLSTYTVVLDNYGENVSVTPPA